MPVVIKNKSGQVKNVLSRDAAEGFCLQLAELDEKDLGLRTDVWVAYHLGLGDTADREKLEGQGVFTAAWPRLSHWFTRPDIGESLLPPGSSWALFRSSDGMGIAIVTPAGWSGPEFRASAKTPWAAFAICLIQAYKAGAFDPKERTRGR